MIRNKRFWKWNQKVRYQDYAIHCYEISRTTGRSPKSTLWIKDQRLCTIDI